MRLRRFLFCLFPTITIYVKTKGICYIKPIYVAIYVIATIDTTDTSQGLFLFYAAVGGFNLYVIMKTRPSISIFLLSSIREVPHFKLCKLYSSQEILVTCILFFRHTHHKIINGHWLRLFNILDHDVGKFRTS